MKELILSNMFINKLYKFFFLRNKKVFQAIAYLIVIYIITIAYYIYFFMKLDTVIANFTSDDALSNSIFTILMLIILTLLSVVLSVQLRKLQKESKYGFIDELSKTYPVNSTETITVDEVGITSKNSADKHVYSFQYNDIACYYKSNNVFIFQSLDDSFIFIEFNKEEYNTYKKIIKSHNIKKKIILKDYKKKEF